MDPDLQATVIAEQAALYGAALGDSVRRVSGTLGLSQAAVARTLGVSAPMLSQLVRGQRIKIANPLAVQRLRSLLDLADDVEAGLAHGAVGPRIETISREESTTLSRRRDQEGLSSDPPLVVSGLLRAVASGRQLATAADLLQDCFPDLAEVVRVYGTGRPEEAQAHYAGLAHLI